MATQAFHPAVINEVKSVSVVRPQRPGQITRSARVNATPEYSAAEYGARGYRMPPYLWAA